MSLGLVAYDSNSDSEQEEEEEEGVQGVLVTNVEREKEKVQRSLCL